MTIQSWGFYRRGRNRHNRRLLDDYRPARYRRYADRRRRFHCYLGYYRRYTPYRWYTPYRRHNSFRLRIRRSRRAADRFKALLERGPEIFTVFERLTGTCTGALQDPITRLIQTG